MLPRITRAGGLLHCNFGILLPRAVGCCDDSTDSARDTLLWQITKHVFLIIRRHFGRGDVSAVLACRVLGPVWVARAIGRTGAGLLLDEESTQHRNRSSDHDYVVFANNAELENRKVVRKIVSI